MLIEVVIPFLWDSRGAKDVSEAVGGSVKIKV
jgi:hypothetical protein